MVIYIYIKFNEEAAKISATPTITATIIELFDSFSALIENYIDILFVASIEIIGILNFK